MTIERAGLGFHAMAAIAVLALWFGGLALVALLAEPTATVIVIAPAATALHAALASDGDLLDAGSGFTIMRSARRGFVRDLYANGAWLVWPAIEGGCLSSAARSVAARTRERQIPKSVTM
jgi:hypothetical protein